MIAVYLKTFLIIFFLFFCFAHFDIQVLWQAVGNRFKVVGALKSGCSILKLCALTAGE